MPGFERIRFTRENFHDDLICKYCFNILYEPVTCQTCQVNFCAKCADIIVKEQSKKENILRQDKLGCIHNFQPSSKYLTNKLNKLELKCKYWFMGCDYVSLLENMVAHQESCSKKPKGRFNTVEDLLIKCPKGCQKLCTIDELQRDQHDCVKYLKEQIVLNDSENQKFRKEIIGRLDEIEDRMEQLSISQQKMELEQQRNEQLVSKFEKIDKQQKILLKEYNDCGLEKLEQLIRQIQQYSLERMQSKIKNSDNEVINTYVHVDIYTYTYIKG